MNWINLIQMESFWRMGSAILRFAKLTTKEHYAILDCVIPNTTDRWKWKWNISCSYVAYVLCV